MCQSIAHLHLQRSVSTQTIIPHTCARGSTRLSKSIHMVQEDCVNLHTHNDSTIAFFFLRRANIYRNRGFIYANVLLVGLLRHCPLMKETRDQVLVPTLLQSVKMLPLLCGLHLSSPCELPVLLWVGPTKKKKLVLCQSYHSNECGYDEVCNSNLDVVKGL